MRFKCITKTQIKQQKKLANVRGEDSKSFSFGYKHTLNLKRKL